MSLRTLRRGSRGRTVTKLQNALIGAAGKDDRDCVGNPFPRGKTFTPDGDFGGITKQAVEAFQELKKRSDPEFSKDGICGPGTWAALGFTSGRTGSPQNSGAAAPTPTQQRLHGAQGRRPGQARQNSGLPAQVLPPAGEDMPPWMATAWAEYELNVREVRGVRSNPRIIEYLGIGSVSGQTVGHLADSGRRNAVRIKNKAIATDRRREARRVAAGQTVRDAPRRTLEDQFRAARMDELDEVPWCAAFVGWCLAENNMRRRDSTHNWGGNFLGARSWRPAGGVRGIPRYGAICVKDNGGSFHVGFMLDHQPGRVRFLGGNQGNALNISEYVQHARRRSYDVLTFLWPPDIWPNIDPPA